jgi:hypothetical protein
MLSTETARDPGDPFDLARFTSAQQAVYDRALAEIRSGDKRSHWTWFLFPQIDGLGFSSTAKHYAIKSAEEAHQYLAHPVLGPCLLSGPPHDRDAVPGIQYAGDRYRGTPHGSVCTNGLEGRA